VLERALIDQRQRGHSCPWLSDRLHLMLAARWTPSCGDDQLAFADAAVAAAVAVAGAAAVTVFSLSLQCHCFIP